MIVVASKAVSVKQTHITLPIPINGIKTTSIVIFYHILSDMFHGPVYKASVSWWVFSIVLPVIDDACMLVLQIGCAVCTYYRKWCIIISAHLKLGPPHLSPGSLHLGTQNQVCNLLPEVLCFFHLFYGCLFAYSYCYVSSFFFMVCVVAYTLSVEGFTI